MNFKPFYFVLTFGEGIGGNWHRDVNLAKCLKELHHPKKYIIYTGICKEHTPNEVVVNLMHCWNVTGLGGITFYDEPHQSNWSAEEYDRQRKTFDEDIEQRKQYFMGWITEKVDLTRQPKKQKQQL